MREARKYLKNKNVSKANAEKNITPYSHEKSPPEDK